MATWIQRDDETAVSWDRLQGRMNGALTKSTMQGKSSTAVMYVRDNFKGGCRQFSSFLKVPEERAPEKRDRIFEAY